MSTSIIIIIIIVVVVIIIIIIVQTKRSIIAKSDICQALWKTTNIHAGTKSGRPKS